MSLHPQLANEDPAVMRETAREMYKRQLVTLLSNAMKQGFVITVETQPIGHAMGSYQIVWDIRDANSVYRNK